jgi:predicted transcriptional regulator
MSDRVRTVKMPDSLWEEFGREAKRQDRSKAWILRAALEEYLNGKGRGRK